MKLSTQTYGPKNPSKWAPLMPTKVNRYSLKDLIDATENVALSKEYIDRTNPLTERQLVLASRRLAKTLQSIYGENLSPLIPTAFLQ